MILAMKCGLGHEAPYPVPVEDRPTMAEGVEAFKLLEDVNKRWMLRHHGHAGVGLTTYDLESGGIIGVCL